MPETGEKVLRKGEMYKEMETSAEMMNLAIQSLPPTHLGILPMAQPCRSGQLAARACTVLLEARFSAFLPLCPSLLLPWQLICFPQPLISPCWFSLRPRPCSIFVSRLRYLLSFPYV